MNKEAVPTGNPVLYCVDPGEKDEDEDDVPPETHQPSKDRSPVPAKPDTTSFDIVKATQYGAMDRVKSLIDDGGFDVNQRDKENVTLLHWAAINNRKEIITYFLQKGIHPSITASTISVSSALPKKIYHIIMY